MPEQRQSAIQLRMPPDDHPWWEEFQGGVRCRSVTLYPEPDGWWGLRFDSTGAKLLHDHLLVMGLLMALATEGEKRGGLSEPQREAKHLLDVVLSEVLPEPLGPGNFIPDRESQ